MQTEQLESLEGTICPGDDTAMGFHGPVFRNVGHRVKEQHTGTGGWLGLRCLHMALSTPLFCSFYSKDSEGSWFRSLFVHKVDPRKDAHSTLLSKKETSNLYKIQCE